MFLKKNHFFAPNFILFFTLLGLFFCACGKKNKLEAQSVPSDIVQPKKMKEILVAIHLAEAQMTESAYQVQDSASYFFEKTKKQIFKTHKIDSTKFQKSFAYYNANPDLTALLYNQIVDSLKKKEEKLKKTEEKTKNKDQKNNKNTSN